MSKHTPGPWAVEFQGNGNMSDKPTIAHVGDWRVIQDGRGSRGYDLHEEDENDARLIAAAPELLEALKETIPFMVDIAKARHHTFELHMADDDSTIGKAMRAIAKAESQS